MNVVVIGSGFGGLAAAIRLQAQGDQVTVLEKRDKPGGRAYVYEQDGFTFDGGPTIITAPWLIDELFALGGRKTADYVQLVPVDPFYNIRFEDGSVFRYTGKREEVVQEVRRFNPTTSTATCGSPRPPRTSSRPASPSSTSRSTASAT
jgi:phytoene desaturase